MVKVRYLPPGYECRMKLVRAYRDLHAEKIRLRPFSPEAEVLNDLLAQINGTHRKLFGEDAVPPLPGHVANPSPERRGA